MKGITPIISTIVLLLITVALAGAAWMYIGGFMGTYTEKSFTIPTGGVYCDNAHIIHVQVVNTGTTTIAVSDWIAANVTDSTGAEVGADSHGLAPVPVSTKSTQGFTRAGGAAGSSYVVNIGTVAGVQHIPIVCP